MAHLDLPHLGTTESKLNKNMNINKCKSSDMLGVYGDRFYTAREAYLVAYRSDAARR